jgi:hypothetical protein
MKHLTTVLLLMLALVLAHPAYAQLGIAAGLNFDSLNDIELSSGEATYDNSSGYHVGVFLDLGAGPLALRPGVFYRDAGQVDVSLSNVVGTIDSFNLTMIEVPVDLRLRLPAPVIKPYVTAGPVFTFPSSDDEGYDENLETFNVAANIGGGLEVNALGIRLLPEVRYVVGVTRFLKEEFQVGNFQFMAEDTQRLSSVMLRLGVMF